MKELPLTRQISSNDLLRISSKMRKTTGTVFGIGLKPRLRTICGFQQTWLRSLAEV
jgi:hypothetical protein